LSSAAEEDGSDDDLGKSSFANSGATPLIGSHVIPKFYLEQFANPAKRKNKPGRIWVYQKGKQPDERGTTVQGAENGYFGYVRDDGTLDGVLETVFEQELAQRERECDAVLFCSKSHLYHWPGGSRENWHSMRLSFIHGPLSDVNTVLKILGTRSIFLNEHLMRTNHCWLI
jgi:hypothetical protein